MTKLEAIKGTRKRWEKLDPKCSRIYRFIPNDCLLCKECDRYCFGCVWYKAYGDGVDDSIYLCTTWIQMFSWAATDKEASLIKDTIIGMLLVLEGEYKDE